MTWSAAIALGFFGFGLTVLGASALAEWLKSRREMRELTEYKERREAAWSRAKRERHARPHRDPTPPLAYSDGRTPVALDPVYNPLLIQASMDRHSSHYPHVVPTPEPLPATVPATYEPPAAIHHAPSHDYGSGSCSTPDYGSGSSSYDSGSCSYDSGSSGGGGGFD